ncbi:VWA domain-containing protein [Saccharothrix deserti]|uniref:VWA domain-containing protein n=1 Tax=Saccharothrix deserti TaxID=2593674 RepID=UPI00131BA7FF|nr:vWA domain-containing protein [Saccharothrix deserti]
MTSGTQPRITLAVEQNEYLSPGDAEMHAVLTVTAEGLGGLVGPGAADAAEVIAIDCSSSMLYPPTKIASAREAASAAIDALRDGVFFAVIAGTDTAREVYPKGGRLVAATAESRAVAKQAVRRLRPDGGTAIGTWLRLADRLLAAHPSAIRHVMLLTDGRNEHETRQQLDAVLAACEGRFTCDARGVGADWSPEELLRIVSVLHGSADAVRAGEELVADFTAMMRTAMDKVVPDVRIRIRTGRSARLRFVKQVLPTQADLTELGTRVDPRTTVFSTGAWGEESRDFHVCLDVTRGDAPLNEEVQAARVDLEVDHPGTARGEPGVIQVRWTNEFKLSSVIHPLVAHYSKQTDLGTAMMAGYEAYDAGNVRRAEEQWGQAVALASATGNAEVLRRLGRLVDVVGEPAAGVVRVKSSLSPHDLLSGAMGSVKSSRAPRVEVEEVAEPEGPDVVCPNCELVWPPGSVFCEGCRQRIEASP